MRLRKLNPIVNSATRQQEIKMLKRASELKHYWSCFLQTILVCGLVVIAVFAEAKDNNGVVEGKAAGDEWDGNEIKMKFCWCPAGEFADGIPLSIDGKQTKYDYNVHPHLFDINQDGVVDIAFGWNWATIGFLLASDAPAIKNSLAPGAPLITSQSAPHLASGQGIDLRGIAGDDTTPTMGDFDGDGVIDIVTGGRLGRIWFVKGIPVSKGR